MYTVDWLCGAKAFVVIRFLPSHSLYLFLRVPLARRSFSRIGLFAAPSNVYAQRLLRFEFHVVGFPLWYNAFSYRNENVNIRGGKLIILPIFCVCRFRLLLKHIKGGDSEKIVNSISTEFNLDVSGWNKNLNLVVYCISRPRISEKSSWSLRYGYKIWISLVFGGAYSFECFIWMIQFCD